MNLRWIVGNFADPEFHLSRRQQREVTRLAHHKHLAGMKLWMWTIAMSIVAWFIVGSAYKPLATLLIRNGAPRLASWLGSLVALSIAVSVAAAWLYRFIYAKPVRMAMRDLGYDVCIGCGYRLQGLNAEIDRCPECGEMRVAMPANTAAKTESPHEARHSPP